jgi:hypothetical protein
MVKLQILICFCETLSGGSEGLQNRVFPSRDSCLRTQIRGRPTCKQEY